MFSSPMVNFCIKYCCCLSDHPSATIASQGGGNRPITFQQDMRFLLCAMSMKTFPPQPHIICGGCDLLWNSLLALQKFKAEGYLHVHFWCAMWGPQIWNSKCEFGGPILRTERAHKGFSFRTQPIKFPSNFRETNPHIMYEC